MTKKLYNDTSKLHDIDTYMLYYPILNVETIIHQDTFSQEIALTDMKLQMKYPGKYLNKQCHRSDYECSVAIQPSIPRRNIIRTPGHLQSRSCPGRYETSNEMSWEISK